MNKMIVFVLLLIFGCGPAWLLVRLGFSLLPVAITIGFFAFLLIGGFNVYKAMKEE